MKKNFKIIKNPLTIITFCLIWFCIALFIILPAISRCTVKIFELPYGKWSSNDPNIVLNIFDYDNCTGIYVKNDEIITISAEIWTNAHSLKIHDNDNKEVNFDIVSYFEGKYYIKGEKLYYELSPKYQAQTGYKIIIFNKIEE